MDVMYEMTNSMDRIRMRSGDKEIIPRRGKKPYGTGRGYKIGMIRLYKQQPTHQNRLTERTGMLKDILTSSGTWSRSKKAMRLKASKHLVFWVKPQKEGSSRYYKARLAIMEKGNRQLGYRIMNETRGEPTKGKKRLFFEPAFKAEENNIKHNVARPLSKLRKV